MFEVVQTSGEKRSLDAELRSGECAPSLHSIPLPVSAALQRTASHALHRRDIDGLRGLAVLLVVLFHTQTGIASGGFIGVDVFFVLSGYLITTNLLREAEATGRICLSTFYARRFKRLLPMSCLVLVFIVVAGKFILPKRDWAALSNDVQSAALYYANVHFGHRVTNYFDTHAANSPAMHYWSLSIEEQFYFVWPLTIALLVAGDGHLTFIVGKGTSWRTSILVILVAAFLGSLLLDVWQTPKHSSTSYFNAPQRTWELLAGSLLSVWHTDPGCTDDTFTKSAPIPFAFLSIVTLLGFGCLYNNDTIFPGTAAIGPVICTAILLHAGRNGGSSRISSLLSCAPLVYLGNISYSIYLWHWPILQYATRLAGVDTIEALPWSWLCCSIVCTFLTSALSYVLAERPCRTFAIRSPGLVISVAIAGTVTIVVLASIVLHVNTEPGTTIQRETPISSDGNVGLHTFFTLLPDAMHDPLTGDVGMLLPSGTTYNPSFPSVVLLGDSHAQHWGAAIHDAVVKPPLKAQYFQWVAGGCPLHFPGNAYQRGEQPCVQIYDTLPFAFKELGFVDVVMFSASVEFQTGYIKKQGIHAFTEHVNKFLDMIVAHTNTLIYIQDGPRFKNFDESKCGSKSNDPTLGELPMADIVASIQRGFLILQRIFADFVSVNPRLRIRTLNLSTEILCDVDANTCNWMEIQNGIIVCRADDAVGHMNRTWVRTCAPRVKSALLPYVTRMSTHTQASIGL
jgi:peptidoglycan/LPS O-acetylase OafA/YrhL